MYWRRGLVVVRFGLLAVFTDSSGFEWRFAGITHFTLIVGLVRKTPMANRIP